MKGPLVGAVGGPPTPLAAAQVGGSGGGSRNGSNSSSAMATPVGTGGALRNHAAEAQVNFG